MVKIRITVMKAFSPEDVFGEPYTTPSGKTVEKCRFESGQTWVSEGMRKPDGFCGWAWDDMRKDLYMLYFGGDIPDTDKGVVYIPCSDGKRPVVFKLERLNE